MTCYWRHAHFVWKSLKSHQKNGRKSGDSMVIAGTGKKVLAFGRWVQPARWDSRLTGSNSVGKVTLLVLKSTPFLFLMSGKSIYKNRNKRCDRLASHVFLFSAKNRIYKQNTHTDIHRLELKSLYFNFDSPLRKRFLRSISRKRLTIEISAL